MKYEEKTFNKEMKKIFENLQTPAGIDLQGKSSSLFVKEINEVGDNFVKVNGNISVNYHFIEAVWEAKKEMKK